MRIVSALVLGSAALLGVASGGCILLFDEFGGGGGQGGQGPGGATQNSASQASGTGAGGGFGGTVCGLDLDVSGLSEPLGEVAVRHLISQASPAVPGNFAGAMVLGMEKEAPGVQVFAVPQAGSIPVGPLFSPALVVDQPLAAALYSDALALAPPSDVGVGAVRYTPPMVSSETILAGSTSGFPVQALTWSPDALTLWAVTSDGRVHHSQIGVPFSEETGAMCSDAGQFTDAVFADGPCFSYHGDTGSGGYCCPLSTGIKNPDIGGHQWVHDLAVAAGGDEVWALVEERSYLALHRGSKTTEAAVQLDANEGPSQIAVDDRCVYFIGRLAREGTKGLWGCDHRSQSPECSPLREEETGEQLRGLTAGPQGLFYVSQRSNGAELRMIPKAAR